ncbi:MAG: hypothetical protein CO186_07670 [Zetaproteobacteria bacterium CG_4_9_14_3_um_filter_49_83]|nr:MAG: hypothetical protein AUJ56_06780 [Zetaproteobacteria bacterium CG1_02_49_23]PIQ30213.1 MAG: hypothetical protein COW62_13220 [Zetaproteobacteria bacterium CG17_big_fil_post_rev_8_21_14_2_50_50_13]PIV30996.1 MAG: hypothetical protein COS35_03760 [Zetaproteobacteria bacterium CG02_land_8_20_14_3_00_50_9]PIY55156.1 MAG: hypothetical protein COZ00_10990 [Zetaproteobacteria bacterium CG_4_10_14_0_8_um_filter_49_80]PJA35106.1 MAG: hypothetical protein CO186_07670 [Zetaproteobacteria bacterium
MTDSSNIIDGVIKYHVEHQHIAAPRFAGYAPLEALRARLFALGLIGEKDGIGFGNLSMRTGKGRSFFISATQTGRQASLAADAYTFIDAYDFSKFTVYSKGMHKPSSEALSHAMIYEVDPAINVVIHIHCAALWGLMRANHDLATTAEYGTAEMVDDIATLYQQHDPFTHNAFVMQGHEDGIVTFGRTLEEAELKLYAIIRQYLMQHPPQPS